MDTCPKCNGSMIGDGYTSVLHCEYANQDKVQYCASDEGPIYCDYKVTMESTISIGVIPGSAPKPYTYNGPASVYDLLRQAGIGWDEKSVFRLLKEGVAVEVDINQLVTDEFDMLYVGKPTVGFGPRHKQLVVYTPTNRFSIERSIAAKMTRQQILDELNVKDPKTAVWCDHKSSAVYGIGPYLDEIPHWDLVLVITENNDA